MNHPVSRTHSLFAALLGITALAWTPANAQPFERITQGPIAETLGRAISGAWGDYDGDGDLDLFVATVDNENDRLYRNDGGGAFTSMTESAPANEAGHTGGGAWGDWDNDGDLDLVAVTAAGVGFIYQNDGAGHFTSSQLPGIPQGSWWSMSPAWADYDLDGDLDLFISVGGGAANIPDLLYRNEGGALWPELNGALTTSPGYSTGCAWGDFDNDGHPDLVVGNMWGQTPFLYRNLGDGAFESLSGSPVASLAGNVHGCTWGDYDNDGDLDLFLANATRPNALFRNDHGNFVPVTVSALSTDVPASSVGCAWADYDNDGWLDLFVANRSESNYLYHNNGDGTFSKVTTGPEVNDGGASNGCAWGDYDNDGFPDLFVANWNDQNNFLYRNTGNANAWLKVRLVGHQSNRFGVGAKVRVTATINGHLVTQLREINAGDSWGSQPLLAQFGLGNATKADLVRIEWPSGVVQELPDVAPRQQLVLFEGLPPGPFALRATATPSTLWPPHGQRVPVNITAWADTGDGQQWGAVQPRIVSVSCNEVYGKAARDTRNPQWIVTGDLSLVLVSKKLPGRQNFRIYTITVAAEGRAGFAATTQVRVVVPPAAPATRK